VATRIYNALNAASIEIPYPKQDVYIRSMPSSK
jgi:small-conductance mechanosensitive channel